jgi:electron transfer flavoprotein alpha subunit
MQTRPALGGNIMATICTKDSDSQMATVRPGVMNRPEPDYSREGKIIRYQTEVTDEDISLEIISSETGGSEANFDADVVVSGGKGTRDRDNYERLVGQLCDSINKSFGVEVERGASRAAVEQGFTDRAHQVGQTGTAVGCQVYFALGISGAIQHMIGVSNSETIIAINSDPEAPIFRNCDYYLVADVEEAVPRLAEELNKLNKQTAGA